MKVDLKGIIKVDHLMNEKNEGRMRVIYYAEPIDPDCIPKQDADSASECATWVTLEEFPKLGKIRGDELLEFGNFIESGGSI